MPANEVGCQPERKGANQWDPGFLTWRVFEDSIYWFFLGCLGFAPSNSAGLFIMTGGNVELCGMDIREGKGVRTVCNKVMSKNGLIEASRRPVGESLRYCFGPLNEVQDLLSGKNVGQTCR